MHKSCDFKETKSSINRLFIFWWNTKEKEKNLKRGGRLLTMNNKTFYFTVGLMYSHWSYLDETHMKKKSQTSDNEQRTFYFKLGRCIIKALTVTRTFLKALFWMLALIFYNGKKKHCTFFIYHNYKVAVVVLFKGGNSYFASMFNFLLNTFTMCVHFEAHKMEKIKVTVQKMYPPSFCLD